MQGKQKCKILKEIRQKIADENDIPYVTRECRHQGNCAGTCPRCESELRYLEQQLALRASLGKRVTVAALCAGMTLTAVGCTVVRRGVVSGGDELGGAVPYEEPSPTPDDTIYVTEGEVVWPEPDKDLYPEEDDALPDADLYPKKEAVVPIPTDLTGDVAYEAEESRHG